MAFFPNLQLRQEPTSCAVPLSEYSRRPRGIAFGHASDV